jgi:hypothetical protein
VLSIKSLVSSGVGQGGVSSLVLFNLYVDNLKEQLENIGKGCSVGGKFLGCIVYTDHILLLSVSVSGLQLMINMCCMYGGEHCI